MANAKKSSSKRSRSAKKMTPAVLHLRYELTNSSSAGTETSHYIDLARDLSAVNRRLYRQGRDYHVKKITIVSSDTPNGGNRLSASVLPNSWPVRMGWTRGFHAWNEMNKNAKDQTNSISGTWADFKVDMTRDAQIKRSAGQLLRPIDNGNNAVLAGEWEYSAFVGPVSGGGTPDTYAIHMLGGHVGSPGAYTSIGLVQSYGDARATVGSPSPDVPTNLDSDPLVNLFDWGDTINTIIDDLEFQNDTPPYDQFEYPGDGDNMPKPLVAQDTTIVDGRAVMGGFNAICGVIEFESKSAIPSDIFSVLVELSSGNYRGVKADVI